MLLSEIQASEISTTIQHGDREMSHRKAGPVSSTYKAAETP
jgi:hypothetical protein